jgi:hypothetical protein
LELAYCSSKPIIQIGTIYALAEYGTQAINAITEVINLPSIDDQVKKHGLKIIENMKNEYTNSYKSIL